MISESIARPASRWGLAAVLALHLLLLVANPASAQNLLVNGDAETGTIIGWTPDVSGASTGNTGIIGAVTEQVQTAPTVYPHQGDWFFSFAVQQTSVYEDSGDRVSMFQTGLVATGADSLTLTGRVQTEFGDPGEAVLGFYSSSGGFLGSASTGDIVQDVGWGSFALTAAVPTGAATWRVELYGSVNVGRFTNVFWDDLSLKDDIVPLDFGDAPDHADVPLYPTLLVKDGARHGIGGPWLGNGSDAPDAETDGQPDTSALGDDNDGNDDENGVTIPDLIPGQNAVITLEVGGQAGYVDGWIDFNGDNIWSQTNETVISGLLAPGSHLFTVSVPTNAMTGRTMARFRINSTGALAPTGAAADGEVEDHEATIGVKWSQGPDTSPDGVYISCTFRYVADDFECTRPGPVTGIRFWGAWRQSVTPPPYDIRVFSDLPAEQSPTGYAIPDSLLWVCPVAPEDFDSDIASDLVERTWIVPGNHVWPGFPILFAEYIVPIPREQAFVQRGTPENPQTYWLVIRYALSTSSFGWNSSSAGWSSPATWNDEGIWRQMHYPDGHPRVGEPIDLAFELVTDPGEQWDFGDAPFDLTWGGYPTLLAGGGAYHVIGGPWLGDTSDQPDPEFDGQPHAQALGDNAAGLDDEGGVTIPTLNVATVEQVTVEINGGGGFLQAWFDFDQDHVWSPGEMVIANTYPDGIHEIDVMVPTHAQPGETFARFRISSNGDLQAGDGAPDGEVEDYRIVIENEVSHVPQPDKPHAFRLYSCAPNPFNPMTTIRFDLPRDERVTLIIYDVSGRRVRTLLAHEHLQAGRREVTWLGRDDSGRKVAAGVYFVSLQAGDFNDTERTAIVK